MDWRRNLLWADCSAGAIVGVAMLLLSGLLSAWYQVPYDFLIFMGIVNLTYAAYSFSLARRSERPMLLIQLLAVANMVWGLLCFRWAVVFSDTASFFGVAHFVLEGIFVGGLGAIEWRWRELLRSARGSPAPG